MLTTMAKGFAVSALALLLTLGVIIALDRTFGWAANISIKRGRFFPGDRVVDGLGWVQRRPVRRHRKRVAGQVIYNVTYTVDELNRRIIPYEPPAGAEQFALFSGGSNTFGEGLNDDETIPALLQRAQLTHRVYNYAVRGYGPHQMLRKFETGKLRREIRERTGIAFYQYFDVHIGRVLGTLQTCCIASRCGSASVITRAASGQLPRANCASAQSTSTLAT